VVNGSASATAAYGLAEEVAAAALTLARSFASGATMWCFAPQWPAHGRHVAVEFVHPVIVGKRALPAVNAEGGDAAGTVRALARPGDAVLVVGTADDERVADLLSRAEAWGLTRFWLGAGPRPVSARAEHIVWVEGCEGPEPSRFGDMVLLYHLLWELTHVVFEHPGLLEVDSECPDEVCITCSDEGRVAEVRAVVDGGPAEVVVGGTVEAVDTTLVEPVVPGDLLLVHAGVALSTCRSAPR
jgi:hydrogenase maturation factor